MNDEKHSPIEVVRKSADNFDNMSEQEKKDYLAELKKKSAEIADVKFDKSTHHFFDENKNFYEFVQDGNKITVRNGRNIFTSELLKKLELGGSSVSPKIIDNELFVFDYNKGFEIHKLDGSDRKFFKDKSAWQVVEAESRLFLVSRLRLTIFDIAEKKVEEKIATSESFEIHKCSDTYLLFYRYKNLKSFLYNIKTKEFTELPNFTNKLEIIKVMLKGDQLIAFYFSGKQPNKPERGVYTYDLKKQGSGNFFFEFSDYSCCGATCLDLLDFSFNDVENEEKLINNYGGDYSKYLCFVLKKFGFFAFLYYINTEAFTEKYILKYNELSGIYEQYKKKLSALPKSKEDYNALLIDMAASEKKALKLLCMNV